MNKDMDKTSRTRSPWPWVVMIISLAVILAVAGLAAFTFWRVETWPARTAEDIADVFGRTFQFQPQVTIEEEVVLEQVNRVAELAVVERRLVVERDYENKWLLSTKRLRTRGTFTAKAGFDLQKGVDVEVDRDAEEVRVTFPAPELLSLGDDGVQFVEWDNGLWNRLDAEDTESAVNELRKAALVRADEEGLLDEARQSVAEQLAERLSEATDLRVVVDFSPGGRTS